MADDACAIDTHGGIWSEALQRSYEELQASREELQALNEELQASNEELNSANAHLQEKINELEMQNGVLSSGAVMTLFLDEDLRVRWFTPAITELFPLRSHDLGRRITDLVKQFHDPRFVEDVREVMQKIQPRDAEVRSTEGKWFMRRIRASMATSETIAGVAVTFTDISDCKRR